MNVNFTISKEGEDETEPSVPVRIRSEGVTPMLSYEQPSGAIALDERAILASLPQRFSRTEFYGMIEDLKKDIDAEEPPCATWQDRVKHHRTKHHKLMFTSPSLYRIVCRGEFRPAVLNNILDARDRMEAGMPKKEALDGLIKVAVDEVNGIRAREKKKA